MLIGLARRASDQPRRNPEIGLRQQQEEAGAVG
jgi:hypothetical protein